MLMALVLFSCSRQDTGSINNQQTQLARPVNHQPANNKMVMQTKVPTIGTVEFELPQQLSFERDIDQNQGGKQLVQWIVKGTQQQNTPLRFAFQKKPATLSVQEMLSDMLKPLSESCSDVQISEIEISSIYANQANLEYICARYLDHAYGKLLHISVFYDQYSHYIVVGEVKLPASEKAGVLNFNTEQQKQDIELAQARIALVQEFSRSIRVCDVAKNCW